MVVKKIKEKLMSKKGASMVEFTMVMLMFLLIFTIGYELVMVGYKYVQVSDYANDIVRTLAVQGGVDRQVPAGFQGGASAYKNFDKLIAEKNAFAKTVGVSPSDLTIRVSRETSNGSLVTNSIEERVPIRIDYLQTFEVTIDYNPSLELSQNFGAKLNGVLRRTKLGLSEYLYDYDA